MLSLIIHKLNQFLSRINTKQSLTLSTNKVPPPLQLNRHDKMNEKLQSLFQPISYSMHMELDKTFHKIFAVEKTDGRLELYFDGMPSGFFDSIVISTIKNNLKLQINIIESPSFHRH